MNIVILAGRLGDDPEVKTVGDKTVASFSVACNRDYKNKSGERETDWIRCEAWRGTADFIQNYFHKGDGIVVRGSWKVESYTDGDGQRRTSHKCSVDSAEFPQGRRSDAAAAQAEPEYKPGEFTELPADTALPF